MLKPTIFHTVIYRPIILLTNHVDYFPIISNSSFKMENQHHLGVGSGNCMPNHLLEDNSNRHPQRVSRFSIQRLDTSEMMAANMPRRRASVNHGQQSNNGNSGNSRSEFVASSYITVDDINLSQPVRPSASGRSASLREHAKGFLFLIFFSRPIMFLVSFSLHMTGEQMID